MQHKQFPNIVPELNDLTLSVTHFDSTFVEFDNNLYTAAFIIGAAYSIIHNATEYIEFEGTTRNSLIVGLNDTTNSDKQIFGFVKASAG